MLHDVLIYPVHIRLKGHDIQFRQADNLLLALDVVFAGASCCEEPRLGADDVLVDDEQLLLFADQDREHITVVNPDLISMVKHGNG